MVWIPWVQCLTLSRALELKWLCPDQRSVSARKRNQHDRPRKNRVASTDVAEQGWSWHLGTMEVAAAAASERPHGVANRPVYGWGSADAGRTTVFHDGGKTYFDVPPTWDGWRPEKFGILCEGSRSMGSDQQSSAEAEGGAAPGKLRQVLP